MLSYNDAVPTNDRDHDRDVWKGLRALRDGLTEHAQNADVDENELANLRSHWRGITDRMNALEARWTLLADVKIVAS